MATPSEDPLERARRLLEDSQKTAKTAAKKTTGKPATDSLGETLETARQFNQNVSWLRQQSARAGQWFQNAAGVVQAMWEGSGPVRQLLGPAVSFAGRSYMRFFRWGLIGATRKRETQPSPAIEPR
jgi:hypothetical protein